MLLKRRILKTEIHKIYATSMLLNTKFWKKKTTKFDFFRSLILKPMNALPRYPVNNVAFLPFVEEPISKKQKFKRTQKFNPGEERWIGYN